MHMRIRALLFTPVLVAMAALGVGSSVASAATLYTDSTLRTPVALGATAVGTAGVVTLSSGTTTVNSCSSSSLNLSLVTNSGGNVVANVTGGSFTGCRYPTTVNATAAAPWRLTVTGTASPFTATVRAVSVTFLGGTYTGDLLTGVTALSGAPLSLVLNNASRLAGPLTSNGTVTGTYRLTGTPASSWALGA
jgi:hypothetical protein